MTNVENPYQTQSPVEPHIESPSFRDSIAQRRTTLLLLVYAYPIWLLASFYAVWLIAWATLGHRPRPMLDDPTSVGGIVDVAYYVPGILLMLAPALLPVGFASSLFFSIRRTKLTRVFSRAGLALLHVTLCASVFFLLRWDPLRVIEWWFD